MNKKEFDEGYQAAVEAIRQMKQNKSQGGSSSSDSDLPQLPQEAGGQDRENDKSSGGMGQVNPEDCTPMSGEEREGEVGSFTNRKNGKELAEQEGYQDSEGGDETLSKEWKEAATKNANKLRGKNAGDILAKIMDIHRTTTDWKKSLKNIIGQALHPEDKDYRFTNKNTLVSQDRIARSDKDKYDNLDSIIVFVDSSGSMTNDMLKKVLAEVYTLANQKKPCSLTIIQCDTKIQEIKTYRSLDELKRDFKQATVKGRGGTELKPCWDLLRNDKKFKKLNELVLVFTDGELTQYPRDKKTMQNLCWCIIDNPKWEVNNKERFTKCIYFDTNKM